MGGPVEQVEHLPVSDEPAVLVAHFAWAERPAVVEFVARLHHPGVAVVAVQPADLVVLGVGGVAERVCERSRVVCLRCCARDVARSVRACHASRACTVSSINVILKYRTVAYGIQDVSVTVTKRQFPQKSTTTALTRTDGSLTLRK